MFSSISGIFASLLIIFLMLVPAGSVMMSVEGRPMLADFSCAVTMTAVCRDEDIIQDAIYMMPPCVIPPEVSTVTVVVIWLVQTL